MVVGPKEKGSGACSLRVLECRQDYYSNIPTHFRKRFVIAIGVEQEVGGKESEDATGA